MVNKLRRDQNQAKQAQPQEPPGLNGSRFGTGWLWDTETEVMTGWLYSYWYTLDLWLWLCSRSESMFLVSRVYNLSRTPFGYENKSELMPAFCTGVCTLSYALLYSTTPVPVPSAKPFSISLSGLKWRSIVFSNRCIDYPHKTPHNNSNFRCQNVLWISYKSNKP